MTRIGSAVLGQPAALHVAGAYIASLGGDPSRPDDETPAPRSDDRITDHPSGFVVAVVDDDPSILRSLEYLLESADHTVHLFTSGAALLDRSHLQEIDCLISDIDMPGMDGFELLRLVQAARPGLPSIIITGYPERLQRMPSFGGIKPRVFTKPFKAEELLAAVSDALRNSAR
jgi:FixJ family two-component response regulator